jgi:(p)ppGpp synthase/HD superfamily hydrolase
VEDLHKHPEKWQPVSWKKGLYRYFSAEVRIEAANQIGMLASVSAAIAGTDTNIGQAAVEQRDGEVSLIKLEVEVKDRRHLARIVRTIRQMPEVLRVTRHLASRRSRED